MDELTELFASPCLSFTPAHSIHLIILRQPLVKVSTHSCNWKIKHCSSQYGRDCNLCCFPGHWIQPWDLFSKLKVSHHHLQSSKEAKYFLHYQNCITWQCFSHSSNRLSNSLPTCTLQIIFHSLYPFSRT